MADENKIDIKEIHQTFWRESTLQTFDGDHIVYLYQFMYE